MAEDRGTTPHRVQPDRPARPAVETREETVARLAGAEEAVSVGRGGSADPSTRRGMQRFLAKRFLRGAAIGGLVGIAVGITLYLLPGPREEGRALGLERTGFANAVLYALIMGIALAVVVAVITSIITLAREDGRVEREVEERTGRGPEGPARPNRPDEDHDLG
jgi:hypothetical protein